MKKIILILFFITSISFGQTFTVDNTFNPTDTGVYNQFIGLYGTILNNGKILTSEGIGTGQFFSKCIYRLNSDGSVDNSFVKFNLNFDVNKFYANPILGNLITVNGDSDNTSIKSYDPNGLIVSSFTSPTFIKATTPTNGQTVYTGGRINKIFFLNDGKFLIFGGFNLVNGVSYNNVVRLNTDGSVDTSFNIGIGFSGETTAFAIQSDGKYVVGGQFSQYNGTLKGMVARLNPNGTLDNSFNVNTVGSTVGYNTNGPINDIIIQPNGKIITSGTSLRINANQSRDYIVRLNSNGSVDTTFNLNYINVQGYYTRNLLNTSDGSIFFKVGTTVNKCNNSGSMISQFNDENTKGDAEFISEGAMSIQNNKLVIVGSYKNGIGITRLGYHRLNSMNGIIDLTFNPSFGPNSSYFPYNTEWSGSMLRDNKILIFSQSSTTNPSAFTTYNDIPVKPVFRLTENGELDQTFNLNIPSINIISINFSSQNPVQMKKNFDGKIYIKGDFFSTNTNLTTKHIIKLNFDGTLDSNFNFYEEVGGFRVTDDNKIIAFGASQIFRNGSQYKIIRFNSDSSVDNTFVSPSFNFIPTYIELVDNNKITVSFGTNTINNSHIIRLNENGSADLITNLVNNPPIFKTKTINDKVYLSSYSSATNSGYLFRYNNDWTVDTSFTQIETPNTSIYLSLSNDRTVTKTNQNDPISGNSTIYRINNSNGILTSSLFLPNETNILMSQNCENIIVCGNFNKVNGFNKHNIYRLSVPSLTITTTPTGEISQLFTQGQTLADLIVNGQNIQWYDSQNQCAFNTLGRNSNQLNSFLPSNTLLVDGTTYYASQTINGFESNHRLPITVYQPLGVNELSLINLKLYPNPIKNNLTISNNLNIDKIELFNLIGQKILEKSLLKNEINLDFTSYNKGIYLLKIFSEGKVQTNKIIKE